MAVLNYSSTFKDVTNSQGQITKGIYDKLSAARGSADWLRLFFSPDTGGAGHLITHGVDYTPDYLNGTRGFVPANLPGKLTTTFLRGDGWKSLWSQTDEDNAAKALINGSAPTNTQEADQRKQYLQTTLVSAADIQAWISQSFSAQDALRFKGVISVSGTTLTNMPTTCTVGDVYKINGTGTVAGEPVGTGDMLICIKDGSANINDAQYWQVVQDNVEALVTHSFNGTDYHFYSSDSNLSKGLNIYAPTTAGTAGQMLISSGTGAPTWVNQANITAGKVGYALSVGTGLKLIDSQTNNADYDGSKALTLSLKIATTTTLGGVRLGQQTQATLWGDTGTNKDTKQSTISIDTNTGDIYLTRQNIVNALGYTPDNASSTYSIIVGANATATTAVTTATTSPYVNLLHGSTLQSALQFVGDASDTGGAISVSGQASKISISIRKFTGNLDGIVPHIVTGASGNTASLTKAIKNNIYLLGSDAKWYNLPDSAFEGTWRHIQVGGTTILDNTVRDASGNQKPALNLVGGGKTTVTAEKDSNNNYTGKVNISSSWRTIKVENPNGSFTDVGDHELDLVNSDGIYFAAVEDKNDNKKMQVSAYMVWYNVDTQDYEGIL